MPAEAISTEYVQVHSQLSDSTTAMNELSENINLFRVRVHMIRPLQNKSPAGLRVTAKIADIGVAGYVDCIVQLLFLFVNRENCGGDFLSPNCHKNSTTLISFLRKSVVLFIL